MEKTQLDKAIDQYIDKLIEVKGLSKAQEDEQKHFRETISEMIIAEYNKEILRRLPDDKLDEFSAALDDESKTEKDLGEIIESANIDEGAALELVLDTLSDEVMKMDINNMKVEA